MLLRLLPALKSDWKAMAPSTRTCAVRLELSISLADMRLIEIFSAPPVAVALPVISGASLILLMVSETVAGAE